MQGEGDLPPLKRSEAGVERAKGCTSEAQKPWETPCGREGRSLEHTGEMLYKTDRRHGLRHGGEQLAFLALA